MTVNGLGLTPLKQTVINNREGGVPPSPTLQPQKESIFTNTKANSTPTEQKKSIPADKNEVLAQGGKIQKREVDGQKQEIAIIKDEKGQEHKFLVKENGTIGEPLVTISTFGKNKYITQTEHDKKMEQIFHGPMPEGIEVSYKSGTPVFKKDGKTLSTTDLKQLVPEQNNIKLNSDIKSDAPKIEAQLETPKLRGLSNNQDTQQVTIKEGQTIWGMVKDALGKDATNAQIAKLTNEILAANPQIKDPSKIKAGTKINIPTQTPKTSPMQEDNRPLAEQVKDELKDISTPVTVNAPTLEEEAQLQKSAESAKPQMEQPLPQFIQNDGIMTKNPYSNFDGMA